MGGVENPVGAAVAAGSRTRGSAGGLGVWVGLPRACRLRRASERDSAKRRRSFSRLDFFVMIGSGAKLNRAYIALHEVVFGKTLIIQARGVPAAAYPSSPRLRGGERRGVCTMAKPTHAPERFQHTHDRKPRRTKAIKAGEAGRGLLVRMRSRSRHRTSTVASKIKATGRVDVRCRRKE